MRSAYFIGASTLALSTILFAAPVLAGEIRGQIFDADSNSALPGAQVVVEGSGQAGVSSADGSFVITNVAPGAYRLSVDYVGYPEAGQSVTVGSGGPATVRIGMANAEAVTVTGQRQAERMALQRKRSADNLIETLNSNDVGKLPDQNVAEAVRRLPGVTVANDQGEGRYVILRGAPPSLTNVTVNGQTAPAPEPDGRQVKLDDIPASLVGSLTVTKSLTPDMDANAIAGQVDITTLTAFDRNDSFLYGHAAAGYYNLSGKSPYEGDLTVGTQFGEGDQFGVVLSGNYSTRPIESENFGSGGPDWSVIGGHLLPSNQQIRDYTLTRERVGAVGNFDWRVNPDLKLFLHSTYSSFSDAETRDRFTFSLPTSAASYTGQTATTGSFTTGGRGQRYVRRREEDDHTLTFSTGGNWVSGLNVLDFQATFSEAVKTDPTRNEWQFRTGTKIGGTYDLSNFLYVVNPAAAAYDPSQYAFNQLVLAHRQAVEHLYQARVDYERPVPFGSDSSVKLGFKYLDRKKKNDEYEATFKSAGTAMTLADVDYLGKAATYDGRYTVGPRVNYNAAQSYFLNAHGTMDCDASTVGGFACDQDATASDSNAGDYNVSEQVIAGYWMLNLKFGGFTVTPGFRIEATEASYGAKQVDIGSGTPVITPLVARRSYTDAFPGINFRYDINESLVARAAVTTAIGRPDYSELPPYVTVDTSSSPVDVTAGNPALKPLYATNYDAALEYYLPGQGVLSINLFRKEIKNPIYEQQTTVTGGTFGAITIPGAANVDSFTNARSAHLTGVELNAQEQFTFLPSPFDGLGASANISYVDGHTNGVPGRADLVPMFQQSRYVGTVQAYYEKYGVNVRLAYSYRSRYLDTLGASRATDQYTDFNGQLDARASYDINDNFVVYAEAANLNDAPWRRFIGSPSLVYENERYSWSGKAGLQVKF